MPTTLSGKGDALIAYRVVMTARRISPPQVVARSARHKAQQIVARDDVYCIIDAPLKARPTAR